MSGYLTTDAPALAGRTGRGIRIAVIDSGVAPDHPHVGHAGAGTSLVGDDPADTADRLGHGTAVAAAIREKAQDAELIPVRVLERELATSARILAQAIEWAVDQGVDLVNLSLGTTNEAHIPLFEHAIGRARERGIVVVSARSHAGVIWYPGGLSGAVGVLASEQAPRGGVGIIPGALGAGLVASPYPRPIPGVSVERNLSGVSFAVANATGILALALEAGAPRDDLPELLHWIARQAAVAAAPDC